jgi:hypothetical protein
MHNYCKHVVVFLLYSCDDLLDEHSGEAGR